MDLDDTLINTRDRTRRIMADFARSTAVQTSNPLDAETLEHLSDGDIRYNLPDTFKDAGITDPALLASAQAFWLGRFFSNDYAATDVPNPGAVDYVNALHNLGATIVYLTGRDTPRMGAGTRSNLIGSGFPVDDRGLLMMKPDKSIDDLQFKKDAFASIGEMGKVTGVFENEPRNVNAMHTAFPDATPIFLDTIHSSAPDVVADGISFVRNFHGPSGLEWDSYALALQQPPAATASYASSSGAGIRR